MHAQQMKASTPAATTKIIQNPCYANETLAAHRHWLLAAGSHCTNVSGVQKPAWDAKLQLWSAVAVISFAKVLFCDTASPPTQRSCSRPVDTYIRSQIQQTVD